MHSRWYNVAVIILWLAAMSWLVARKVLPPLLVGDPPSYRTIVEARKNEPSVGWRLWVNGRRMGWALNHTVRLPGDMAEIRSRVHFDELPIEEMVPGWLHVLLGPVGRATGKLPMDARNVLTIDPLGHLTRFESVVSLDRLDDLIKLRGAVEGDRLSLDFRSGTFTYPTMEVYLPRNAILADTLSPQTRLPGLRAGQTWTVPVYSPFRPPNDPLEILQAKVEGTEPIVYGGDTEEVWLVVYRSDPGYNLGGDRRPRGRLWVRPDGAVLQQQVTIFNATLTFERLTDQQAVGLAEAADR